MASSRYTVIGSGSYKGHAYIVYVYQTPFGNYGYVYTLDGSNVANSVFYGANDEETQREAIKYTLQELEEKFGPDKGKPDPNSVQDKGAYKTFKDSDGTYGFQTPSTGLIKTGYNTRQGAGIAARSAVEAAAREELDRLGIDAGGRATEQLLAIYEGNIRTIYEECSRDIGEKFRKMLNDGGYLGKLRELQELVESGQMTQDELEHAMSLWSAEFNRVANMNYQMFDALVDAENEAAKVLNGMLADGYVANGAFGMFQIEDTARVEGIWGLPDKATVQRLIRDGNLELVKEVKPKTAKTYEWSRSKFNAAITQGVMQGESIPKIVKRVRAVVDMDRRSAFRAARTAMTNAQNAGRIDSYRRAKNMGIDVMNEWEATLDNRTRISHRHLMGERVEIGEKFSNGLRYPADPEGEASEVYNCRCTLIPYVGGIDYQRSEDWFKHVTIEGATYEEWLEGKKGIVKGGKDGELAADTRPFADKIATCTSPQEVARLMDEQGWFKDGVTEFDGVEAEAARRVAIVYDRIFSRFPQLVGQFGAPDTGERSPRAYASCSVASGKVHLNTTARHGFANWRRLSEQFASDVSDRFHPQGVGAEGVVVHELGHAIDGWMRAFTRSDAFRELVGNPALDDGVRKAWGNPSRGWMSFSMAMRERVMKSATGSRFTNAAVRDELSGYATEDAMEWFAEAFAEYICSDSPRRVAQAFGEELERMMAERDRIETEYSRLHR